MAGFFKDEEKGPTLPQRLTSPLGILALLRPLYNSRAPVTLRFADHTPYRTSIVELAEGESHLALDEVVPKHGNHHLQREATFKVETALAGVRITWENTQAAIFDARGKFPCYWIKIPTSVNYYQRRKFYRATLLTKNTVYLNQLEAGFNIEGLLMDISVGGCKMKVAGKVPALTTGIIYESLVAELENERITTPVELRHIQFDETRNTSLLGFRFCSTDKMIQRKIESFVNQLQRDARNQQEK